MPEAWLIALIVFLVIIAIAFLAAAIKIIPEYQRAAHFRLGRFIGLKGPGIILIIPVFDKLMWKDLRVMDVDVRKQRIVTRDNVSADVDAVVYMRVFEPSDAVLKVEDHYRATSRLAQTTVRDILGQVELDDLLSKREDLSERIREILDRETDPWGVKVTNVTIKDVDLPEEMVRAIASQAEAERDRRARVTKARGEEQASEMMAGAAEVYAKDDRAMRLRELQTLVEVATEKNLVVVTPSQMGSDIGTMAGIASASRRPAKAPGRSKP